MTFPATVLGMTAELYLNGAWTDLTSLVQRRNDLVVTRGRANEGQQVERSTCEFAANNRDGNLSPRNPLGIYYGQLGRNTPMRVRLSPSSEAYVFLPWELARANTPDTAALSITGDMDVRIDILPTNWANGPGIANKWLSTGNQRSWALYANTDGTITLRWTADGSTFITKTSTAAVVIPASGRIALRATLDVDNGAVGNDVKFYTAPSLVRTTLLSGDNHSFATGIGTWGAGNANTTVAAEPAQGHDALGALKLTSVAAGNISARSDNNISGNRVAVTAGSEYLASAWFKAAASARTCQVLVNWYDAGAALISQSASTGITSSTSAWTLVAQPFTAPAGAVKAALFGLVQSTGGASEVHYVDDAQLAGGTVWTQLGATVTTAAVTSIFDSTANLEIGGSQGNGTGDDLAGRIYRFELCSGLQGLIRSEVEPDDEEPQTVSFVDTLGNVWTFVEGASIVRPDIRFSGEIAAFPPKWDVTGRDVWVEMEAAGILQRLGQGSAPLKSTLLRAYTTLTGSDVPKAYWPCEDGEDAKSIGSGLAGKPAMTIIGSPNLASNTDFKSSQPIPVVGSSKWAGTVLTYAGTGTGQVWFLLSIPSGGTVNGAILVSIQTTGTIVRWDVSWETGGNLRLRGYDANAVLIEDSLPIAFNINGAPERMSVSFQQNGADIDWDLNGQTLDSTVGGLGGTAVGETFTRIVGVRVNPNGSALDDVAIGQIAVHNTIRDPFTFLAEFVAHAGETAGRRVERLCDEEGIAFRSMGNLGDSAGMGAQLPKTLIELVREAATTDGGILFEPRDFLGLAYRPRTSMYAQASALDLDYSTADLSGFEPVEDDQQTRNDVTAQRTGGASARSVLESGALSIQAPPNGVGTYDEEVEVNTFGDAILESQAGWRVFLGTVDESRYPVIELDLSRPVYVADPALVLDVQDIDIGDRLTVTNLPVWLPPEDVSQLAQGFKELMSNFAHRVAINCSPASPWAEITSYDATAARFDSPATVTAEVLDTTETGVDITVTGPIWSHADGDFDVMIDGERMTVTAISGSGPAQTFTVTRSVNGIVKSHATGVSVHLADPVVYAL